MDLLRILFPEPILSVLNKPISYDMRFLPDHSQKPIIIFIHGFKGFKNWGYFDLMADTFAQSGFVFIKLNLSHNGTTPEQLTEFIDLEAFGNNNFSKELDDIGTMIDYVNAPDFSLPDVEFNRNRIFLIGHSRGGSLAILKAYEDKRVKALVTMAAVTNLEQRWPEPYLVEWKQKGVQYVTNTRTGQILPMYYQIVEDYYQNRDRFNVPIAIQHLDIPFLAFHGSEDETVPVHMAYEMERRNSKVQVEIIQGAGHTFGGGHPFHQKSLPPDVAYIVEKAIQFFKAA